MREGDYLPLLQIALREDLGDSGDVTSQAVAPDGERAATLWSKDTGVLAGEEVFAAVFRAIDPDVRVRFALHDGAFLEKGQRVAEVSGRAVSLLSGERTSLNFISFLSGIATATRSLVMQARATGNAVILDTRKTLPGWRALSKYAVTVGGGRNHRQGLYDMVLIKDNHIDSAGSIAEAVRRVRARWGTRFVVEVECRSAAEVSDALAAGVDIIMLDNMEAEEIRREVQRIAGRAKVEASGTMTPERIPAVSAAGVDFISVGAITHSVRSFDFSLKIA
ncbi:MAG: carboxylating nicotinate-nucleotide diphosphorylase [Spirochaetia bacterium]|jgi:nicotinate-nucleotide pyrophosphorylase (carboxylating)